MREAAANVFSQPLLGKMARYMVCMKMPHNRQRMNTMLATKTENPPPIQSTRNPVQCPPSVACQWAGRRWFRRLAG